MEQDVLIPGDTALRGRFFAAQTPRAVAVLNGATAVPHRFYHPFARWLAQEQQVSCLTYDYRDFADSLSGPITRSTATMADWGIHDTIAARAWATQQAPDLPVWMIGHSLGGLMLAHHPRPQQIDRMIAVCSGPVHSADHPMPYRLLVLALWHVIGPLAARATGYIPGRLSGLGADLPRSVFAQWKRWCTTPGFDATDPTVPTPNAQGLTCPLRTVALSDDSSVPPPVVARLAQRYPNCPHTEVILNPRDHGLGKIGHAAIFARRNAALWPQIIAP